MTPAPGPRHSLALALLLGTLLLVFVGLNTAPAWLVLDIQSSQEDSAQVFYSSHGNWTEERSFTAPLVPGLNRIGFRLPNWFLGVGVRLDPGMRAGTYGVLGMHWYRGLSQQEIDYASVRSARTQGLALLAADGRLEIRTDDADPQLLIPPPSLAWQIETLLWPLGIYAAGVLAMCGLAWRRRVGPRFIAGAYVVAAAVFFVLELWRHAPVLPIFDDWRYVLTGSFNIVDGGTQWLRAVGNDTYFLTGQLLDFLSLSLSNTNFAVVRYVALALLLLHLWLMWRVLHRVANGISEGFLAVAAALLVWCLASNGYWGGTAIAYHQFLPVLAGSLMLAQLANRNGEFGRPASMILLGLTALASGLAYISGGLMVMSLGAALLLTQIERWRSAWQTPILRQGAFLFGLGAALLLLQLTLVTHTQGSLLEHSHAAPTVYPSDRRFWLFFAAQFGRALGYAGTSASVDLGLTLLVMAPAVWLGVQRLRDAWRGRSAENPAMLTLVLYGGIAAALYCAVVAFGRAGFVAPDASADLVVAVAKARFHYWTVAALLPFLWLGLVLTAQGFQRRWVSHVLLAAAVVMLVPKSREPWDLVHGFRAADGAVTSGAYCIAEHMAPETITQAFTCAEIIGVKMDLSSSMQRLKDRNSVLYQQIERYRHPPLP